MAIPKIFKDHATGQAQAKRFYKARRMDFNYVHTSGLYRAAFINDVALALDYLILIDHKQFKDNFMFKKVAVFESNNDIKKRLKAITHIVKSHRYYVSNMSAPNFILAVHNMLNFWEYQKNYIDSYNGKI